MYYVGFSYEDAYSLPVWQRVWYINRLNEEIKRSNGQTRGMQDPGTREMSGMHRNNPPANLRRFT